MSKPSLIASTTFLALTLAACQYSPETHIVLNTPQDIEVSPSNWLRLPYIPGSIEYCNQMDGSISSAGITLSNGDNFPIFISDFDNNSLKIVTRNILCVNAHGEYDSYLTGLVFVLEEIGDNTYITVNPQDRYGQDTFLSLEEVKKDDIILELKDIENNTYHVLLRLIEDSEIKKYEFIGRIVEN